MKAIVAVGDHAYILDQVDAAAPDTQTLKHKVIVAGAQEGWVSLEQELSKFSEEFPRPAGEDATHNDEIFLTYFTSGTTGWPKWLRITTSIRSDIS